jgi:predicted nucleic acid-binding Zn finger protein
VGGLSRREERARKLVEEGSVKRLVFLPSGRILWFVVGDEGDHLVDKDVVFCTCSHFYFRTIGQPSNLCAHLAALDFAMASRRYESLTMSDAEYATVLRLFFSDLLHRLSRRA